MPIHFFQRPRALATLSAIAFGVAALTATSLPAQSLTVGGLTATIQDERGAPLRDVTVTLERAGAAVRTTTTDRCCRRAATPFLPRISDSSRCGCAVSP